ncbi:unnamed protein product [Orchesella dallaii]|uniref:ABC transporter domain-containing protein n=1 Tax=Orchesella dallaii TaxID=48710 RepID=A0ABP1QM46_9HEXA
MWELSTIKTNENRRYTMGVENGNAPLEDLHAWSIYRQNLNSDFTDSALGSDERSPLPYGNFQLREQTVQSILRHPRLAPRSELGSNMYAYLKFGLPRVFPPNRNGNSSGYDSESGDGRIKKRAKSVVDERTHGGGGGGGEVKRVTRARSETDLIDGLIPNRFGKPNRAFSEVHLDHNVGSNVSLVSRGIVNASRASGQFNHAMQHDHIEDHSSTVLFPHLQIRGLCYQVGPVRILDAVFLDLRGGEMISVMATADAEGTSLMDVLTSKVKRSDRISGEIWLNGNQIPVRSLGTRVAYVTRDYRLHPDITVIQTMQFHGINLDIGKSEKRKRMHSLLDDLGLSPVRSSVVESLTSSEIQRLSVACQLLQEPEIICLDQPTRGMDIFDTFFLVEYMKQWAYTHGRIVLMTIHPPTFEIFSMFTKVLLLSTGRVMFYGHRSEMLPYFAFIEYPCPAFKNPSDYYIDLVTLDTLSNEALLESSQRIETLAESFRRKQEPLSNPQHSVPQHLPRKIYPASAFIQFYSVFMYMIVLKFPWNIVNWITSVLFSAALSIAFGAIYWNIRFSIIQDQNNLNDRIAFHWVINAIGIWPVLLLIAHHDKHEIAYVHRDVKEGIYSSSMFVVAKTLLEIPFIVTILLGYLVPCYVMGGVQEESAFYSYIGHSLLYAYVCVMLLRVLINSLLSHTTAFTIAYIGFIVLSLGSTFPVHIMDLGSWCSWVRYASPIAWSYRHSTAFELSSESLVFTCPNNPLTTDTTIVTQLQCQVDTSVKAITFFGLRDNVVSWVPALVLSGVLLIAFMLNTIMFILRGGLSKKIYTHEVKF